MRRKRHQVYIELNANYFQSLKTVLVDWTQRSSHLCMNRFGEDLKLSTSPRSLSPKWYSRHHYVCRFCNKEGCWGWGSPNSQWRKHGTVVKWGGLWVAAKLKCGASIAHKLSAVRFFLMCTLPRKGKAWDTEENQQVRRDPGSNPGSLCNWLYDFRHKKEAFQKL